MNKKISAFAKVIAVAICVTMILATLCACGLFGNGGDDGNKTPQPSSTKLSTPVVTISEKGLASWGAIANATGYEYEIDSIVGTTTKTRVQLQANHNRQSGRWRQIRRFRSVRPSKIRG